MCAILPDVVGIKIVYDSVGTKLHRVLFVYYVIARSNDMSLCKHNIPASVPFVIFLQDVDVRGSYYLCNVMKCCNCLLPLLLR